MDLPYRISVPKARSYVLEGNVTPSIKVTKDFALIWAVLPWDLIIRIISFKRLINILKIVELPSLYFDPVWQSRVAWPN